MAEVIASARVAAKYLTGSLITLTDFSAQVEPKVSPHKPTDQVENCAKSPEPDASHEDFVMSVRGINFFSLSYGLTEIIVESIDSV